MTKLRASRDKAVAKEKDAFEATVKRIDDSYIKKLEALKLSLTKNGDLDGALEIRNEIAKVKGGEEKAEEKEEKILAGTPAAPGKTFPNTTRVIKENEIPGPDEMGAEDRLELIKKALLKTNPEFKDFHKKEPPTIKDNKIIGMSLEHVPILKLDAVIT